ncbi:MAG: hypothetical protein ACPGLV_03385 [Bacteroidia bacterium]
MSKTVAIFIISLFAITFQACEPDYPVQPNATVVSEGLDCGWLVKFNEKPADLPESENNTYIAVNLPDKYKMDDTGVMVTAREATEDELLACTALGIAYVQIFITDIF